MILKPDEESCTEFLNSIQNYSDRTDLPHNRNQFVTKTVGRDIALSIQCYLKSDFAKCAELLEPLYNNNQIVLIGGSNAQRDVFNLLYLNALIHSKKKSPNEVKELINQRKIRKLKSDLNERLLKKLEN